MATNNNRDDFKEDAKMVKEGTDRAANIDDDEQNGGGENHLGTIDVWVELQFRGYGRERERKAVRFFHRRS